MSDQNETITAVPTVPVHTRTTVPTVNLRWVLNASLVGMPYRLQQAWQGSDGKIEWRDVPRVEDGEAEEVKAIEGTGDGD